MSTLINWLEAGRRLAERIPYSLVALVAPLLLLILARGPGAISLNHLLWGRAHTASSAEQSSSSCVATATPQRGAVSDPYGLCQVWWLGAKGLSFDANCDICADQSGERIGRGLNAADAAAPALDHLADA